MCKISFKKALLLSIYNKQKTFELTNTKISVIRPNKSRFLKNVIKIKKSTLCQFVVDLINSFTLYLK